MIFQLTISIIILTIFFMVAGFALFSFLVNILIKIILTVARLILALFGIETNDY